MKSKKIKKGELLTLESKLSAEQLLFCDLYLDSPHIAVTNHALGAFPDDPDPRRRAMEILENEDVIKYINLRRSLLRKFKITPDDVVLEARDILMKCKEPVPIINKQGHPTGEYEFDSKGALKALEILAKYTIKEDVTDGRDMYVPHVVVSKKDLKTVFDKFNDDY